MVINLSAKREREREREKEKERTRQTFRKDPLERTYVFHVLLIPNFITQCKIISFSSISLSGLDKNIYIYFIIQNISHYIDIILLNNNIRIVAN